MRAARPTLICFSHLRWDFVFQRPQHLLCRAAKTMDVIFWEEADRVVGAEPNLALRETPEGVLVACPSLPPSCDEPGLLRAMLDQLVVERGIVRPILWYYTPEAIAFSDHLHGHPVVYDCMDELSAFHGANPALPHHEKALMARAALVFTGGHSLFEAKRTQHPAVHPFPSGVDVDHFRPARSPMQEPVEQSPIPHPRAGFYGVIDERIDMPLLAAVADLRPGIHFVMVGPVVKIEVSTLPRRPNIHWLGAADYAELPGLVANWDVALMPFAVNAATRFISPTKTPEYLAAGRPVISTPIADVVRQYGTLPGVGIAATPAAFAAAIDHALTLAPGTWQPAADRMLDGMAWDLTWSRMADLVNKARLARVAAA